MDNEKVLFGHENTFGYVLGFSRLLCGRNVIGRSYVLDLKSEAKAAGATFSIAFTCIGAIGSAKNDSTSTREISGTSSLSSSSLFTAIKGTISDIPVMFSEGLER